MPELPEVETTRRGISPHILNKTVQAVDVRQRKLRWPIPDDLEFQLVGRDLIGVRRRAKYLLLEFEHGTLMIHLGMSGSLRVVQDNSEVGKHDHVDFVFADHASGEETESTILRYNDPRKFGAVLWIEDLSTSKHLAHLGPEPLVNEFNGLHMYKTSRTRSVAVKQFIMDNKVVVGVGNIYANEALFKAGINPTVTVSKLGKVRLQRLAECIKAVLAQAIEQGGTTLKDFVGGDGKPGYFQQELMVYGRAGLACYKCGSCLEEIKMQGRTTVYCSKCQKS